MENRDLSLKGPGDCSGKLCGYTAYDGDLGCESGSGSCWQAQLLEADTSIFHDATLQDATRRIKEILESIPEDPEGRKLSFVHTERGTLLAWVRHGVSVPAGRLTIDSPFEDLASALKLRTQEKK